MVKGVNRQIIEVKNPGSEYFDRALLFLKAGSALPPDKLGRLASEYVKEAESGGLGLPDTIEPRRSVGEYAAKTKRLERAVGVLAVAFLASLAACAVLLIVYTKIL